MWQNLPRKVLLKRAVLPAIKMKAGENRRMENRSLV
jgi:hypothetical protein